VLDEAPDQIIQGRALLIECLPNQQTEFWRRWLAMVENESKPPRIGIELSSDYVGAVVPKCLDGFFEITDMMIGPF
jgi:hypothetical protein